MQSLGRTTYMPMLQPRPPYIVLMSWHHLLIDRKTNVHLDLIVTSVIEEESIAIFNNFNPLIYILLKSMLENSF